MILRPSQYDIETAVQRIMDDENIAFGVMPSTVNLRDPSVEEGVEILHLSGYGPTRERVSGKGYSGPVWRSEIDMFSNLCDLEESARFMRNILGDPSHQRRRELSKDFREIILRYDFPIDRQPEQTHPAPHLVYFSFHSQSHREYVERDGHLEFGDIGYMAERITHTPRLQYNWDDAPKVVEATKAKLAENQ